jgi:hypothetical protein
MELKVTVSDMNKALFKYWLGLLSLLTLFFVVHFTGIFSSVFMILVSIAFVPMVDGLTTIIKALPGTRTAIVLEFMATALILIAVGAFLVYCFPFLLELGHAPPLVQEIIIIIGVITVVFFYLYTKKKDREKNID